MIVGRYVKRFITPVSSSAKLLQGFPALRELTATIVTDMDALLECPGSDKG